MVALRCLAALGLLSSSLSFSLDVASLTNVEDQLTDQFWISQLTQLRHEVLELQKITDGNIANLQVSQRPVSNRTSATKTPLAKGRSSNATAAPTNQSMQKMLATADTSGAMGEAMLSPMMGMLKTYVQQQKSRIGELNKQEEADKKKFDERKAEHEKRLKQLENRHQHGMLDKVYNKAVWQENHNFKRVAVAARDRHKRSFHNTLKMIHGMMAKEKTMIAAYSGALSAKPTSQEQKKKLAKLGVDEPDVVLVQCRAEVAQFCTEALTKIREELRQMSITEAEIEKASKA